MGYVICIGNLEENSPYIEETRRSDAPIVAGSDDNMLCPSAGGWSEFCDLMDFNALFFEPATYGGLRCKKGPVPLTEAIYQQAHTALKDYEKRYPWAVPGWTGKDDEERLINYNFARLVWMNWWMKWALDFCERPAFTIG